MAGDGIDLRFLCQLFRGNFVAHGRNGMVFGSNKNQTLVFTSLGKCFVLTEETVTRVNGLGAGGFGRRDDFFSHQIRLARSRWPNQD